MPPGAKIKSAALASNLSGHFSMIQTLLTDYFACPKFWFGLSEIRSFGLQYFTNHWHYTCHWIMLQPSHTLGNFKFNILLQPFQFIPWDIWHTFANLFLQFFNDKIERIRSKFSSSDSNDPHLFPITPPYLSNFNLATYTETHNLVFSSENK